MCIFFMTYIFPYLSQTLDDIGLGCSFLFILFVFALCGKDFFFQHRNKILLFDFTNVISNRDDSCISVFLQT